MRSRYLSDLIWMPKLDTSERAIKVSGSRLEYEYGGFVPDRGEFGHRWKSIMKHGHSEVFVNERGIRRTEDSGPSNVVYDNILKNVGVELRNLASKARYGKL